MPGRMRSYTSYEEEDGILVPSIEPIVIINIKSINKQTDISNNLQTLISNPNTF
jgi:hypothetical protein